MKQSLFQRIRNVVLADLHHALDEQEHKNPIALLNQYVREGERETRKIEQLIERHNMLKVNFLRELEQAKYMAHKRKQQADIAKQAREGELEARAWQEAAYYEEQEARLHHMYTTTAEQVEELQQKLIEMKNKLQEMQAKRLELMGRENMAHASQRLYMACGKLSEDNPFLRFEAIENYMQELELRVRGDYERDAFDYKIARLEKQVKESSSQ